MPHSFLKPFWINIIIKNIIYFIRMSHLFVYPLSSNSYNVMFNFILKDKWGLFYSFLTDPFKIWPILIWPNKYKIFFYHPIEYKFSNDLFQLNYFEWPISIGLFRVTYFNWPISSDLFQLTYFNDLSQWTIWIDLFQLTYFNDLFWY